MTLDRLDVAKWTEATTELAGKLEGEVEKVLAEDASRGFAAPSGDALDAILGAGQDIKVRLVEADGKIYAEQRQNYFEVDEYQIKVLVRIAKLALERYREKIFNALELERSQATAIEQRKMADVERLNSETEARAAAIIYAKADIEKQIAVYKQQLVAEQFKTLPYERVLIQAQLETAEKKMEIIDSIYAVLAAEQLVLAAERRRAAALTLELEAEREIEATKKEMVPIYLEKAQAEQALAQAIIDQLPVLKALEELGFGRVALKSAEEAERVQETMLEVGYEGAKQALVTAETSLTLAKQQAHLTLTEYHNEIQGQIIDLKKELDEMLISFRLSVQMQREINRITAEIEFFEREAHDLTREMNRIVATMKDAGQSQADTIKASASTVTLAAQTDSTTYQRILKG